MAPLFDAARLAESGWRQGCVLADELAAVARQHAPPWLDWSGTWWLVITSHDCDVVNPSLEKEPAVEVLRASVGTPVAPSTQELWGRHPRTLKLEVDAEGDAAAVLLSLSVHDRWLLPRELLTDHVPRRVLPSRSRRLVAEWLAKRYIRAAFPTAFDHRWRSAMDKWLKILRRHSAWIQGVYLRLNTLDELPDGEPYHCHVLVAVPHALRGGPDWSKQRDLIERDVEAFWHRHRPQVECDGVMVSGTDEITLADLEVYQRFDADWVSFSDDTPSMPVVTDLLQA